MTREAVVPEDLPDPAAVLTGTAWSALCHGMGPAEDTPGMLTALLDGDQRARSRALEDLHHVVHHQNTLYEATVPAAIYVAAIVTDPRTVAPVDKGPHSFPGPMRAELLGWLGSVAYAADDESAAVSRRVGFPPEDYPPFVATCRIRPLIFRAVSACLHDPDPHVREAAIAAGIPLLDDPRLHQYRTDHVSHLRNVLAVSELWQYRERAIETLDAWGEDTTGLEVGRDAFEYCNSNLDASSVAALQVFPVGSIDDLPF